MLLFLLSCKCWKMRQRAKSVNLWQIQNLFYSINVEELLLVWFFSLLWNTLSRRSSTVTTWLHSTLWMDLYQPICLFTFMNFNHGNNHFPFNHPVNFLFFPISSFSLQNTRKQKLKNWQGSFNHKNLIFPKSSHYEILR